MARQYIDFAVPGADKDSGDVDATAIKPIIDGEPGFAANFKRPTENLRTRTETIRNELDALRYMTDADRELLLTSAGNVTWNGIATGIFTADADLTLKPFLAPDVSTPATLIVHTNLALTNFITISTSVVAAPGRPRAYSGANKFIFDVSPTGVESVATSITDSNEFHVTYNPGTSTNNSLLTLLNTDFAFVTAALVATLTGTGTDLVDVPTAYGFPTVNDQLPRYLSGAADAEKHIIPTTHFSTFFIDPLNALLEGDVLCISYDDLVMAGDGGRRQSINEGPESKAFIPVASLFILRRFPERMPLALPLATVINDKLIFINRRVFSAGETGPLVASDASYQGSPAAPNSWADGTIVAGVISFEQAFDTIIQTLGTKTTLPSGSKKVGYKPAGNISGDNVQDALTELDTEKAGLDLTNVFLPAASGNLTPITTTGKGRGRGVVGTGGPGAPGPVFAGVGSSVGLLGFGGGVTAVGVVGQGGDAATPGTIASSGTWADSGVVGVGTGPIGSGIFGVSAATNDSAGVHGEGSDGANTLGVVGIGKGNGAGVVGLGSGTGQGVKGTSGNASAGVSGIGSVTAGVGMTGVTGLGGGGTLALGGFGGQFQGGSAIGANVLGGIGIIAIGGVGSGTGIPGGSFGVVGNGAGTEGVGVLGRGIGTGWGVTGLGDGGTAIVPGKFHQGVLGVGGLNGAGVMGKGDGPSPGVQGAGGITAGAGVRGDGGPGGPGGYFQSGTNYVGIESFGDGAGLGVLAQGGATGGGVRGLAGGVAGDGVVGIGTGGSYAPIGLTGVVGASAANAGVVGLTQGALGGGTGAGVVGRAVAGVGVFGTATGIGVNGFTSTGVGVEGQSNTGVGVRAISASSDGLYATSGANAVHGVGSGIPAGVYGENSSGSGESYGTAGLVNSTGGFGGHFVNTTEGVGLKVVTAGKPGSGTAQFYADGGAQGMAIKAWNPPQTYSPFTNELTPKNICKAWGTITWAADNFAQLQDGFNVASVTTDSDAGGAGGGLTTVTFASSIGTQGLYGTGTITDAMIPITPPTGQGLYHVSVPGSVFPRPFDSRDLGRFIDIQSSNQSGLPGQYHNEGRFVITRIVTPTKVEIYIPNGDAVSQSLNGKRWVVLHNGYSVSTTIGGADETLSTWEGSRLLIKSLQPVIPVVVSTFPEEFTFQLWTPTGLGWTPLVPAWQFANRGHNSLDATNIIYLRSYMRNYVFHFEVYGPQF